MAEAGTSVRPDAPARAPTAGPPGRVPASLAEARRAAACDAVERLLREHPRASAKRALTDGGRRSCAVIAVVALAALLAPETVLGVLVVLASGCFVALIVFRAATLAAPPPARARRDASRRAPPTYSVLVPLHREADVVADLVAALNALDYPSASLDIKLVLEADDHATIAAADALALPPCFEILRVPPGEPRTKPRALNFALAFARGELVVIFDAEDRPAPGQLRAALDAFDADDERLACVQAPLAWYNARETWLTRQFALEYAALFHVVLPALARWGWPFPLGGTSNHFRRAALERAGGWDPYNVTEDADLGFRLAELGYRSTVIAPVTREEAVTTLVPWARQRSRWIKGHLQTLLVRVANLPALARHAGIKGLASVLFTLALPLASSFLHGPIALLAIAAAAAGRLPLMTAAFLAAGYAVAAASAHAGLARSGQRDLAPALLLMPLYWPLHSFAALRAAADLARRPFHWEKTRHGVTRLGSAGDGRLARAAGAPPAAQQPERGEHDHEPRQRGRRHGHHDARRLRQHADEARQGEAKRIEGVAR